MDHAGDPSQYTEQNIDQKVGPAAGFQEDGQRREEEGQEVEADVGLWVLVRVVGRRRGKRGEGGGRDEQGRGVTHSARRRRRHCGEICLCAGTVE